MVPSTKTSIGFVCLFILLTVACSQKKKDLVPNVIGEPPAVHEENVSSLIADSGITRYRLEADVWDIYTTDTNPRWHFPEGLYVERFDSLFNVEGSIKSDTAFYFTNKKLWQLIGNVHIQNLEGTTFDTSELFWDESAPSGSDRAIYTHRFVTIHTKDQIITAEGLKSDMSMNNRTLYGNTAIIYITPNDSTKTANDTIRTSNDTIKNDSIR